MFDAKLRLLKVRRLVGVVGVQLGQFTLDSKRLQSTDELFMLKLQQFDHHVGDIRYPLDDCLAWRWRSYHNDWLR